MKDNSFYEGQFVDGEINGMGIRKWAYSNNVYEGEFVRGELQGKGIMKYGDGSVYEGDWLGNKREGLFIDNSLLFTLENGSTNCEKNKEDPSALCVIEKVYVHQGCF